MPGSNGEFDSSVADETATAGYQDGMSLGGHIGSILFRLPQQRNFAPLVHHSEDKAGLFRLRSLNIQHVARSREGINQCRDRETQPIARHGIKLRVHRTIIAFIAPLIASVPMIARKTGLHRS
jgi:hypothetical protein